MIHFVVALHCEAKPLIDFYALKRTTSSSYEVYENKHIKLIVSGIGSLNAVGAVHQLAHTTPSAQWINVGLAGHPNAKQGSLYLVSKVSHKTYRHSFYPYMPKKHTLTLCALMTLDQPSQDYQSDCLYDMEGYGFFFAASKFAPLEHVHSLKIISDQQETDLKTITPELASKLVGQNLTQIDAFKDTLQSMDLSHPKHPMQDLFLSHWHFSETEKHKLSHLLNILNYQKGPHTSWEQLQTFSKKAFLMALEKEVFDLEIRP